MLFEAYPRYYSSFVKAAMDPRDIHLVLRLSTKFITGILHWNVENIRICQRLLHLASSHMTLAL